MRPLTLSSVVVVSLISIAATASAVAASRSLPHPRLTSDYFVSVACSQPNLRAGDACRQTDVQVPYVSPAEHPQVFSDAAAAEDSAPGSRVAVNFFNAGCVANPAIQIAVQPFSLASATANPVAAGAAVTVGTVRPVAPEHWATELDFTEPNVKQVYGTQLRGRSYPERAAYLVLSFSGVVPKCEGTLVRGFFGVNLLKQGQSPTLSLSASAAASLRAGLSFQQGDHAAGFFKAASSASTLAQCLSGCDVVKVRVTSKGKGLGGARVTVSLGRITPLEPKFPVWPRYPGLSAADLPTPYLCQASTTSTRTDGTCDAETLNHVTDSSGKVQFLFWTPGVLTGYRINLKVRVVAGSQTAQSFPTITVNPYKIAWHNAMPGATFVLLVGDDLRDVLDAWAVKAGLAQTLENAVAGRAPNVQTLLTTLLQNANLDGLTKAFGPLGTLSSVVSQTEQEQALTALVLDRFDMTTYGLGTDTSSFFGTFARAWASQQKLIEDGRAQPGFLTNYGAALDAKGHGPQQLFLDVREVSYCAQGQDCASGGQGIKSYLYFGFWAGDQPPAPGHTNETPSQLPQQFFGSTVVPYDPGRWISGLGDGALKWLTEP